MRGSCNIRQGFVTVNIESSFDVKANRICLITKQEGEEVRLKIRMSSVTKPCHAGLFKGVNAEFY